MDNKTEMIRQQMDETRTALTDKLEVLEHQVVGTVQGASSAVAETVEDVKEIVHDTMQTVKDSVHETVETMKDAFDLKRQVDRRPWTMMAGATALGFLGGYLLRGGKAGQGREGARNASTGPATRARTAVARNGAAEDHHSAATNTRRGTDATALAASEGPSLMANLGDTFHAEIAQLKGLAVGALLGIVRDIVADAVPEQMERQVEDVIDGITVKLGGQPIRGRLLPEGTESEDSGVVENQEGHACFEQNGPPRVLKSA